METSGVYDSHSQDAEIRASLFRIQQVMQVELVALVNNSAPHQMIRMVAESYATVCQAADYYAQLHGDRISADTPDFVVDLIERVDNLSALVNQMIAALAEAGQINK